tara:strand:- start:55 stop:249 length:195 start_codon:yes stop_codon:yes gene_type:complete
MVNKVPERPKTTDRSQYKTVALPHYEYKMLREMADEDHRSIARQLGMYIQKIYNDRYTEVKKVK